MKTIVHLSDTAFISILVAAIESYPSCYEGRIRPYGSRDEGEIFGLLFGQKTVRGETRVFNATIATPMHILMDKDSEGVSPSAIHLEKIKEIIEGFPMYQFLGTFHSHTWAKDEYKGVGSAKFSKIDEDTALMDAEIIGDNIIEVILGLTYLKRVINKSAEHNWHNIQSYCGNYKYTLAGYVTNMELQKLMKIDNLICPFASGLSNFDLDK